MKLVDNFGPTSPPSPNMTPAMRYAGMGLRPIRSDNRANTASTSTIAPSSMNATATSFDAAPKTNTSAAGESRAEQREAVGRADGDDLRAGHEHVFRSGCGGHVVAVEQC